MHDKEGNPLPLVSRHMAATILKPEKEMDYRLLHQNMWQGVSETIGACKIPVFDLFLTEIDGQLIEIYYFDYVGSDLDASFKKMAADPITRRWWKLTDPCQSPLPGAPEGNNWRDCNPM
ncbi:L-rhamnose mutarotase [Verrucomicrobiaceae bacterium N1E253]|uniref:L-rhamnose mutarotase n=2 Tax=Oceaniferula marina TaxID=2748318 RepID=A0A851GMX0_9BACT|nr:L-rhamnose mutarotase [Oceaniferula marina]